MFKYEDEGMKRKNRVYVSLTDDELLMLHNYKIQIRAPSLSMALATLVKNGAKMVQLCTNFQETNNERKERSKEKEETKKEFCLVDLAIDDASRDATNAKKIYLWRSGKTLFGNGSCRTSKRAPTRRKWSRRSTGTGPKSTRTGGACGSRKRKPTSCRNAWLHGTNGRLRGVTERRNHGTTDRLSPSRPNNSPTSCGPSAAARRHPTNCWHTSMKWPITRFRTVPSLPRATRATRPTRATSPHLLFSARGYLSEKTINKLKIKQLKT